MREYHYKRVDPSFAEGEDVTLIITDSDVIRDEPKTELEIGRIIKVFDCGCEVGVNGSEEHVWFYKVMLTYGNMVTVREKDIFRDARVVVAIEMLTEL